MEQFKIEVGGNYYDSDRNGLLFTEFSCNGLFYWDICKDKVFLLGKFKNNSIWCQGMFHAVVKRGRLFFFIPFMADGLPYFDGDTKEINYCGLPTCLENKNYGHVIKNNLIYLFPDNLSKEALILDMDQKKVTKLIPDWSISILENLPGENEQSGFFQQGEQLWISYRHSPKVFELTLDSWEVRLHTWKELEYPVILPADDDGIWVESQGKSSIYHLDNSGTILESYKLNPEQTSDKKQQFSRVIKLQNGVKMILPNYTDKIFFIDTDKNLHCRELTGAEKETDVQYFCYYYLDFTEEVWLLPHTQADLIIVNLQDFSLKYKKMPVPENWHEMQNYMRRMKHCESVPAITENQEECVLQDFCDYITNKKEAAVQEHMVKNNGNEIWKNTSTKR